MNDCISRQAVINAINKEMNNDHLSTFTPYVRCKDAVKKLPSVTPKFKTGHWIDDGYYADNSNESVWRCSECDHHIIEYDMQGYKFCPNCGCRMVGDDNENGDS